ncbi:MAG: AbrB/MazE/SpoVT family DNA-binding domain-containing protein [Proteobacteria bacterium]|nr:AbrB/MazE/SpoVT family DNA-binding domain-containing protein [Pseudomonadota bacterium]
MKTNERHIKIFRNGRNQAIRIPKEFEMEGDEAIIRKEGNRLIVEPVQKGKLLSILSQLQPIQDEFPDPDSGLLPLDDIKI